MWLKKQIQLVGKTYRVKFVSAVSLRNDERGHTPASSLRGCNSRSNPRFALWIASFLAMTGAGAPDENWINVLTRTYIPDIIYTLRAKMLKEKERDYT